MLANHKITLAVVVVVVVVAKKYLSWNFFSLKQAKAFWICCRKSNDLKFVSGIN